MHQSYCTCIEDTSYCGICELKLQAKPPTPATLFNYSLSTQSVLLTTLSSHQSVGSKRYTKRHLDSLRLNTSLFLGKSLITVLTVIYIHGGNFVHKPT